MPVEPFSKQDWDKQETKTYKLTLGTGSLLGNAATLGAQTLSGPAELVRVILPPETDLSKVPADPTTVPGAIVGGTHFTIIFRAVVGLTIAFAIANGALVIAIQDMNIAQSNLNSAFQSAWQLGLGAIVGLLTGRSSRK